MLAEGLYRRWMSALLLFAFFLALAAAASVHEERPAEQTAGSGEEKTADGFSPGRLDGAPPRQDALSEAGAKLLCQLSQQFRGVGLKDGAWSTVFRSAFFPFPSEVDFRRLTQSDTPLTPYRIVNFLHKKDGMK